MFVEKSISTGNGIEPVDVDKNLKCYEGIPLMHESWCRFSSDEKGLRKGGFLAESQPIQEMIAF